MTIDTRNIEKGSEVEFSFETPMPLKKGESTPYTITAVINGEIQLVSVYVAALLFEPHKRVLIEEGTGAWCGNCPRGILALEYIERILPNHVVPEDVHNGDIYSYVDYTAFNDLGGYPSYDLEIQKILTNFATAVTATAVAKLVDYTI